MKPSEIKNLYERLGIPQTSSEEDIKTAYRLLSQKWHPDKNPGNEEESRIEFLALSEAYVSLTNKTKKYPDLNKRQPNEAYEVYNEIYKDILSKYPIFRFINSFGISTELSKILTEFHKSKI